MIVESGDNPTRQRLIPAEPFPVGDARLWESIRSNPDLIEPGWTILASDLPLGDGSTLPVLATDAADRLTLVLGGNGAAPDVVHRVLDACRRVEEFRPWIERLLAGRADVAGARPRVVVLVPHGTREMRERISLLRGISVVLAEFRGVRVDGRPGLWIEAIEPSGGLHRPQSAAAGPGSVERLETEARRRIEELSPEIEASEEGTDLVFRFQDEILATMRKRDDALEIRPRGRSHAPLARGRSDLEEALQGVIEEFFAMHAPGAALEASSLSEDELREFLRDDDSTE